MSVFVIVGGSTAIANDIDLDLEDSCEEIGAMF
jgi:hypothetical protein